MKSSARVVVIGGGVGGASILYWLARLGWKDAVLCERADLTSGSTFHSAGLVGQLRGSLSLTRMMMNSVELYRSLADEVGLETGWHEVGSLRLASSQERMEELSRQAGWAKTFGLPLELVSAAEAQRLFPPMSTEGVLGAAYLPTDGYIDPSQLTYALAEGARKRGAEISTNTRVTAIDVERGRVRGVQTDKGPIETEVVVNAGGMFAGEIGALAGVTVPVIPMAHEYLITKPSGIPLDVPTMRDPSLLVYFRGESGGLVMGGYERHPAPWGLDGIPADFNGKLLAEDWDRFEELMTNAVIRVPDLEEAEVVKLVNGPEAFTPDGEFILGETDVRGFWVASGFCAHGLAGAGGMGQLVAEWIVEGQPSLDTWEMDSRRFGRHYASREYTLARTLEVYQTYYDVKYPGHERQAGRPLRLSPTYERLQELGAAFGEKSGWERANWFEPNAEAGDETLRPRGWAGRLWSPAIGVEHRACREAAALFDETSFAKIEVLGPGAADFLERLCDNRVARDVGAVTYTQMLNPRGGIECDFTVTRLSEDRFRIVTGTAFGQHDLAWIRSHAPEDGSVYVEDVTSRLACLGLWGPRARDILQPLTESDLSNEAFPYMRAREIPSGPSPASRCASRTSASSGGSSTARPSSGAASGTGSGSPGRRRGSSRAAIRQSTRSGSRRATGSGARRYARGDAVRSRARIRGQAGQGRLHRPRGTPRGAGAEAPTRVHRARRPSCGGARLGAGADRRRVRGPGDERGVRLHDRALSRLCLRACPRCNAGPEGGDRDLRRVRSRRDRGRAALRPARRASPELDGRSPRASQLPTNHLDAATSAAADLPPTRTAPGSRAGG